MKLSLCDFNDSRKHPWKLLWFLKNKTNFPFGVYRSVSVLFHFFNRIHAKISSVFHYSLVTQMANRSQTSTGLSVYVYGRLHKVLTLPATVLKDLYTFGNWKPLFDSII